MTHADTDAQDIDLHRALAGFTRSSVLVIGDVMLDRFVRGAVDRISPEAPIPILSIRGETAFPGGAGNVVRNLSAVGTASDLIALVGEDDAARRLEALLSDGEGTGDTRLSLCRSATRPTAVKTRFMAGTQQLLRTDEEETGPLTPAEEQSLMAALRAALPKAGAVVISDYGKGVCAGPVLETVIAEAAKAGLPVLVDPKGADFGRYRGADLVTPNRAELALATGMPTASDADVVAAARKIISDCGIRAVLATRSEQGMSLVLADQAHHLPVQAREVFDVAGAGDTVVALMAAGLAAGESPLAAAWVANLAGGVVVAKAGTAVAYPDELLAADHGAVWKRAERKVHTLGAAADLVSRWRQEGRRVGFTNGCFDLLHPGHIHLLEQARRACDRLVVGLNSDESVARLKGPQRPVQSETGRAAVLASLAAVDAVVIFGEDTPINLINGLKPDVLIKGKDYTVETVVGSDLVAGWGGTVFLADLLDGHSTTRTVKRLSGG